MKSQVNGLPRGRNDKSFVENLDRTRSTDVNETGFNPVEKAFSFEALYSCVHFLPTKEPAENASFLLLPALVVCLPSKSVVKKTFKKFFKSKLKIQIVRN